MEEKGDDGKTWAVAIWYGPAFLEQEEPKVIFVRRIRQAGVTIKNQEPDKALLLPNRPKVMEMVR